MRPLATTQPTRIPTTLTVVSARIWLVIPTYNESDNVEPIIRAVAAEMTKIAPGEHRILIVDDGSPDGTGQIADRLAQELEVLEVLHRTTKDGLGRAYIAFAVSRPGHFRVMFHGEAKSSRPTEPGLRAFHLLRDAVLACQEAGTAPAGDPGALVLTAWSAVHGFATLWVDRALPFEGMRPELMAPELGRLLARMFAALARAPA